MYFQFSQQICNADGHTKHYSSDSGSSSTDARSANKQRSLLISEGFAREEIRRALAAINQRTPERIKTIVESTEAHHGYYADTSKTPPLPPKHEDKPEKKLSIMEYIHKKLRQVQTFANTHGKKILEGLKNLKM